MWVSRLEAMIAPSKVLHLLHPHNTVLLSFAQQILCIRSMDEVRLIAQSRRQS
jgi:hypothetical protein